MSGISLMGLAVQKADWLAARQAVLAQNIANANTPGYRARDLLSFDAVLADTDLKMTATSARHLSADESGIAGKTVITQGGDATYSGNNVSLEKEMAKLGETGSQYALSINLIKSQHRLAIMSLKG
jgi:flagellar basal-body rod protein FlgB